jgi:hypothetical protein
MLFNAMAFPRANHIGMGRRRVYYARYNVESVTQKFNLKNWECGFRSLERQRNCFIIADKDVSRAWDYCYWQYHFIVFREIKKAKVEKECASELKKYASVLRKNIVAPFLTPIPIRSKIWAVMVFLSPGIASKIMIAKVRKAVKSNYTSVSKEKYRNGEPSIPPEIY